jgi:hypothetical protein
MSVWLGRSEYDRRHWLIQIDSRCTLTSSTVASNRGFDSFASSPRLRSVAGPCCDAALWSSTRDVCAHIRLKLIPLHFGSPQKDTFNASGANPEQQQQQQQQQARPVHVHPTMYLGGEMTPRVPAYEKTIYRPSNTTSALPSQGGSSGSARPM